MKYNLAPGVIPASEITRNTRSQGTSTSSNGVHFFKARVQGMVKVRAAQIKALATEEFETGGITGHGKREGVAALRIWGEFVIPGRKIDKQRQSIVSSPHITR